MAKKNNKKLLEYLRNSGVLDSTPEAIAEAKRTWRRMYLREYRRTRRKNMKELTITFSLSDFERIQRVAKDQGVSVHTWIRKRCNEKPGQGTTEVSAELHQALVNIEVQLSVMYSELEWYIDQTQLDKNTEHELLETLCIKISHLEEIVKMILPTSSS